MSFLVVILALYVRGVQGDDVAWIIDSLRGHERLYADMDVRLLTHYETGSRDQPRPQAYRSRVDELHYVSQSGMYRSEQLISGALFGGKSSSYRWIKSFDGAVTRSLADQRIANIEDAPSEDGLAVLPHTLLLRGGAIRVPLSVWLGGPEAIAAHPLGEPSGDNVGSLSYLGVEDIKGLKCHHVSMVVGPAQHGGREVRRDFWLAEDRNWLPVQIETYALSSSESIPTGIGRVTEFQEEAPALWFPVSGYYETYNKRAVRDDGRQVLQWKRTYSVTELSFAPQYPTTFFTNVDVPNGAAVYEISQGEITRGYRQGEVHAAAQSVASPWWKTLLWLNALAAAAIGAVLVRRRVRQSEVRGASSD